MKKDYEKSGILLVRKQKIYMTVKVYLGASHTKLGGTSLSFNVLNI